MVISNVSIDSISDSNYVRLYKAEYDRNGPKSEDVSIQFDAVSAILYNSTTGKLLFVKQFRPPVYIARYLRDHSPQSSLDVDPEELSSSGGYTIELCAGLVDKPDKSVAEICSEEIFEECGYTVPPSRLQYQNTLTSPLGGRMTLFYAEVTEEDRAGEGGGIGDEDIQVVAMSLPEALDMINDENVNKTLSVLLAVTWFASNNSVNIPA